MIATSSTSWPRGYSKSATAKWKSIPATTKTIAGAKREAPKLCRRRSRPAAGRSSLTNGNSGAAGARCRDPSKAPEPHQAQAAGRSGSGTGGGDQPPGNRRSPTARRPCKPSSARKKLPALTQELGDHRERSAKPPGRVGRTHATLHLKVDRVTGISPDTRTVFFRNLLHCALPCDSQL